MVRANQRLIPQNEPLEAPAAPRGLVSGQPQTFTSADSAYGELLLVDPRSAYGSDDNLHRLDWQSVNPVQLLKNVMRLTAPNPGLMTGPGTNSYLVGDTATGFVVIDPGPADPEHLQRLWRAADGDVRMIVCTHSHADHSPGARPLQALCAAESRARSQTAPPILGLPSAQTARANSFFEPDQLLQNKELITLADKEQTAKTSHSLKVIHTPGHAANHLCLVLIEDGLLFSGDHILNGSTTVVDPPDGNMAAYLDSLDSLAVACQDHGIEFILPAHGYVLGDAAGQISRLKAHRLKREAKVLSVMQAMPNGSMDEWVALAYDDVPPRIWPIAKRSLLAHVERIEALSLNVPKP